MKYQIFIDRGNGRLELEGCWGGEHAHFDNLPEARGAAKQLHGLWPNGCAFVVVREPGGVEAYRTEQSLTA